MTQRAAIYARVSTDMQRDNYSIPSQIKDIMNYAVSHGYVLVGNQYVDPQTGKDTTYSKTALPAFVDDYTSRELSRPGLDAALAFLEAMGFDVLIVHAIDRLARDPYFRQTIEREFMARGAKVEYVLGNYEETPEGEVKKDLDATFAKWENAKRVERCNRGKKRKAEMGKFVCGIAPFGYRIDPTVAGGLSIYEPEAEIIRMIFSWFVDSRLSLYQVLNELNNQGVGTYYQNTTWARSSVHHILINPTYVGHFFYNKYKRLGKQLIKRDKAEWIKVECAPIVDFTTFSIAQNLLEYNKEYMRKTPKRFYLLTGMVVCADCKKAYGTQTAKAGGSRRTNDAPVYRHRMKQGHCSNKTISGRVLDTLVWEKVINILLNPMSLREGYEETREQEEQKQARQIRHLDTLQAAIEKLKQKKAKLQTIYLDPDIGMTKEEYLEQKAALDAVMRTTSMEMEQTTQELQRIPNLDDLKSLEHFAAQVTNQLENNFDISLSDKRQIMQMLNLKVLISKDGAIKLNGWFVTENDGLLSTTLNSCGFRRRRFQGRV
jgi:site-specific DNA recombinase